MHYVYLLSNKKKDFTYTGLTGNLAKRINEHKNGEVRTTKGYLPLLLTWYCAFYDKITAGRFEQYLKSGSGRAFVKKHLL